MDTRTLAAPEEKPAGGEDPIGHAAPSASDKGPWTEFAQVMAEAYRYAPLFA
jgi:hypothetical protein